MKTSPEALRHIADELERQAFREQRRLRVLAEQSMLEQKKAEGLQGLMPQPHFSDNLQPHMLLQTATTLRQVAFAVESGDVKREE